MLRLYVVLEWEYEGDVGEYEVDVGLQKVKKKGFLKITSA